MDLIIVKLHQYPQYLEQCCEMLNDYWPRSRTARLHTLEKSNDNYPCNYVLVNRSNDQVIGHLMVSLEQPATACIESLLIHKNYRRKGLGRYLMNEVEKLLRQEQIRLITLTTFDQVPFYKSIGFVFKKEIVSLVNGVIRKRLQEENNLQTVEKRDDTCQKGKPRTNDQCKSNVTDTVHKNQEVAIELSPSVSSSLVSNNQVVIPLPPTPLPCNNQSDQKTVFLMEKLLN